MYMYLELIDKYVFSGIFSGPLLKQFGYRKVALLGGVLFVSGMYYTAFAENYIQFLISYGMVSCRYFNTS